MFKKHERVVARCCHKLWVVTELITLQIQAAGMSFVRREVYLLHTVRMQDSPPSPVLHWPALTLLQAQPGLNTVTSSWISLEDASMVKHGPQDNNMKATFLTLWFI